MEDVVTKRRDKLTEILGKAHSKVQQILVDAGIDPAIARMIAAARIWQQLQGVAVTQRELLPAVDILPPETLPEDAIEIHCTVDNFGAQQLLFME